MSNTSHLQKMANRTGPSGWELIDEKDAPFHFSFEEALDPGTWVQILEDNRNLAFYAGGIYIATIFGLQWWMKDRSGYELRGPIFLWNLCLGLFAIMGFARTLPGFLYVLSIPGGFYTSICLRKFGDIATAHWSILFTLSKFWELGDTLFIVLRKRPLKFIHWYHHLMTMAATWILVPLSEPINRWFLVTNFGVHSLIYPYLAWKALGKHLPGWVAHLINTLEVVQMIIGLGVGLLSVYYHKSGYDCARHPLSIAFMGWLYASFLLLFGKLFYDSVRNRRKRGKKASKEEKKSE